MIQAIDLSLRSKFGGVQENVSEARISCRNPEESEQSASILRLAQAASQRRKQGYSDAIMSGMAKQNEVTGQITKQNRPDPRSPADAFEQFVEIVRHSSVPFDAEEDEIFRLIKPFLINPTRNETPVRELLEAYAATRFTRIFGSLLKLMKLMGWLLGNRGTYEEINPSFIQRLRELEAMLKTELRPGTVVIHLKPIQYLDTPQGYGALTFHRYRVVVQTLVDPPEGDSLEAVSIHLTAWADPAEIVIDAMTPQSGFSPVGLKATAAIQFGKQQTVTDSAKITGEISGPGAKVGSELQSTHSQQQSQQTSLSAQQELARVEQYLSARHLACIGGNGAN